MKKHKLNFSYILNTVSILVLIVGLVDIWSALKPGIPQRLMILRPIIPYVVRSVVRLGTLLTGLFLIYLSTGLRKGKQVAWIISMVILTTSLAFHLVKGLDFEEFIITLSLILILVMERKRFVAPPDIPSVYQGIKILFFSLFFTSIYGILGTYILERKQGGFNIAISVNNVVKMFFLLGAPMEINPILIPIFTGSIYFIGFMSLLVSIYLLFRSSIIRSRLNSIDLERVKNILSKYSKFSLQNNLLLFNKQYFFGSTKESFIAYKKSGDYFLVLGFPVGKKDETSLIIKEFDHFSRKHGGKPVYCNIEQENLSYFDKFGYKKVEVGHEAFINPKTFSIEGGRGKHLRQAIRKMDSMGYSVQVYKKRKVSQLLWRLRRISNEWLKDMHGSEKLFTVGKFDDSYLLLSNVIVLLDKEGHICAFINFNNYGNKSIAIDLMRHEKNIMDEAMVYLFLKLFEWANVEGYRKISLGDASLYGVGGKGSTITEKTFKLIFDKFNNFYNFKGLYIFKSKFSPTWEPRYIIYPSSTDLAPALIALLLADSSDGFGKDLLNEVQKLLKKR